MTRVSTKHCFTLDYTKIAVTLVTYQRVEQLSYCKLYNIFLTHPCYGSSIYKTYGSYHSVHNVRVRSMQSVFFIIHNVQSPALCPLKQALSYYCRTNPFLSLRFCLYPRQISAATVLAVAPAILAIPAKRKAPEKFGLLSIQSDDANTSYFDIDYFCLNKNCLPIVLDLRSKLCLINLH